MQDYYRHGNFAVHLAGRQRPAGKGVDQRLIHIFLSGSRRNETTDRRVKEESLNFFSRRFTIALYGRGSDELFVTLADLVSAWLRGHCHQGGGKRKSGSLFWICKLQLIELPWGSGRTTQPVHCLVAARFSHQSIFNFDHRTINADRAVAWNSERCGKYAMHRLSLALDYCCAIAARWFGTTRSGRFLRKLPWSCRAVVTVSHSTRLHLRNAHRKRYARSAQYLCSGKRLRRMPPSS
jgi:hypothetical protein